VKIAKPRIVFLPVNIFDRLHCRNPPLKLPLRFYVDDNAILQGAPHSSYVNL
jgi:hypothetical protein